MVLISASKLQMNLRSEVRGITGSCWSQHPVVEISQKKWKPYLCLKWFPVKFNCVCNCARSRRNCLSRRKCAQSHIWSVYSTHMGSPRESNFERRNNEYALERVWSHVIPFRRLKYFLKRNFPSDKAKAVPGRNWRWSDFNKLDSSCALNVRLNSSLTRIKRACQFLCAQKDL